MKILIVNNNMQVGGIQKSLANLLSEISKKHEVELLLFYPHGDLLKNVNHSVKIIKGNFFTRILGMSQADAAANGKITALYRGLCAVLCKIAGSGRVYGIISRLQKLQGQYDAAVSFMQNSDNKVFYGGCNEFVLNSVKARKKAAFIHCDFKNYPGNNPYNRELYKGFDAVACVSDSVRKVFEGECPECASKAVTVRNAYDFQYMNEASSEYEAEKCDGKVMLFTSARISEEKGILRMMPVLSNIKAKGGKFVWYIAGYGPEYDKAVQAAKDCGIEDSVRFLGLVPNPYPYFKAADMVLVPSYNEAAPMVYMEAEYFGTPVFTTNTTSAHELTDPQNSVIAENTDEAIEAELTRLILNPEIISAMHPCPDATNEQAVIQFENMLG